MKKRSLLIIWILVAALVWWSVRDLDLAQVWVPLAQLQPLALAALFLLDVFILSAFGLPWWYILRALGQRVPLIAVVLYRIAGFGWSYFIPGPFIGGEPLQVMALERRHGVPMPVALASVALDRILEWLVNLLVVILGLGMLAQLVALSPWLRGLVLMATVGLLLSFILYFVAVWRGQRPLSTLMQRLPTALQSKAARMRPLVSDTENQLAQAGARHLGWPLLLVALSWVFVLFDYWLLMAMLGQRMTVWQLLAAITINRVAFLVPVPGGVGAVEASQILVMRLLGLDPTIGLAHSLAVRVRDIITGGFGVLWSLRVIEPSSRRQP